jgi:hypothetical protein
MSKDSSIVGSLEPLTRTIDGPFTCVVVVGFEAVTDEIMSVAETCKPLSYAHVQYMVEAMELDIRYLGHRIDFRQPRPPNYPTMPTEELQWIGKVFGVDEAVTAIVCNSQGDIAIGRKYFGTEHTRLERTFSRLQIHADAMKLLAPPGGAGF